MTTGAVNPLDAAPVSGVYVHFPYCLRKCGYCDFLSVPGARDAIPHEAYAEAVIRELHARLETLETGPLATLYVGGGTPSLWSPSALGRVIDAVTARFTVLPELEVTVECNPSSFDRGTARALRASGVNRVSLGVQSLDDRRLAFLERLHDARGGLRAVEDALAAGIPRVSADLIFGVAGQTSAAAAREAEQLAALGPTHLSAYALTIEANTPFGSRARKHQLPLLPEDAIADSFLAVDAALAELGFEHYEVSSFARDGHHSRHNLGYWRGADYLGLGCGAWGTVTRAEGASQAVGRRIRYRNTPRPARYLAPPGAPAELWTAAVQGPVSEVEGIDAETAFRERIMLGLRLATGIDLEVAARALGVEPWSPARRRAVERLVARGRLVLEGGRLRVPRGAWLLADGTIAELL